MYLRTIKKCLKIYIKKKIPLASRFRILHLLPVHWTSGSPNFSCEGKIIERHCLCSLLQRPFDENPHYRLNINRQPIYMEFDNRLDV